MDRTRAFEIRLRRFVEENKIRIDTKGHIRPMGNNPAATLANLPLFLGKLGPSEFAVTVGDGTQGQTYGPINIPYGGIEDAWEMGSGSVGLRLRYQILLFPDLMELRLEAI